MEFGWRIAQLPADNSSMQQSRWVEKPFLLLACCCPKHNEARLNELLSPPTIIYLCRAIRHAYIWFGAGCRALGRFSLQAEGPGIIWTKSHQLRSETFWDHAFFWINDDQWWLGLGGTIPKTAKHYKIPMNWFVQWSEYCFFMCYPHIYLGDHPNIWGWDVTMTHVWKAMLIWGAQLKPRWTRCFWMFLGPFDPKI